MDSLLWTKYYVSIILLGWAWFRLVMVEDRVNYCIIDHCLAEAHPPDGRLSNIQPGFICYLNICVYVSVGVLVEGF